MPRLCPAPGTLWMRPVVFRVWVPHQPHWGGSQGRSGAQGGIGGLHPHPHRTRPVHLRRPLVPADRRLPGLWACHPPGGPLPAHARVPWVAPVRGWVGVGVFAPYYPIYIVEQKTSIGGRSVKFCSTPKWSKP